MISTDGYPSGCQKIDCQLNISELVKRLKVLAQTLETYDVQDEACDLKPLAELLASDFYITHSCLEIQVLAASCITDIFRSLAPECPYTTHQLKRIFVFFTNLLHGLGDRKSCFFKRYLHLLKNLARTKVFCISLDLNECQDVLRAIFKCFFAVIRNDHPPCLSVFLLDILTPLLNGAPTIAQDVLKVILPCLLDPIKSEKKAAYDLARSLILRTSIALEQPIWKFFSAAFNANNPSDCVQPSAGDLYGLLEELDSFSPSLLFPVYPQIQLKLQSPVETDRILATRFLGKMFANSHFVLAQQQKHLWTSFVHRFNDVSVSVRRSCLQTSRGLIAFHPELVMDKVDGRCVLDHLCSCSCDSNENLRLDVIRSITGAAQLSIDSISDALLDCVKQRLLDKKESVRRVALNGLALIYKGLSEVGCTEHRERLIGIENRILQVFATLQDSSERIVVEQVLTSVVLSSEINPAERMGRLLMLYNNLDEFALKSFLEILKVQHRLRVIFISILGLCNRGDVAANSKLINERILQMSGCLPTLPKSFEQLQRFVHTIKTNTSLCKHLLFLLSTNSSCAEIDAWKVKLLANAEFRSSAIIEILLNKLTSFMISKAEILALAQQVSDSVKGEISSGVSDFVPVAISGLKLLETLSQMFAGSFEQHDVYEIMLCFVKSSCEAVSKLALQIFKNTAKNVEITFPDVYKRLIPVLVKLIKTGTPKQSKHAIYCIAAIQKHHASTFKPIFESLTKTLSIGTTHMVTSLAAIGHMLLVCPEAFAKMTEQIVKDFVIGHLLLQKNLKTSSRSTKRNDNSNHLSLDVQAKIQGLKLITRWMVGIKTSDSNTITSSIQLFYSVLLSDGDFSQQTQLTLAEMAKLRLQAGCCLLKLAQNPVYEEAIDLHQFQTLALLLNDPSFEVRSVFARKLHKGLQSLRLPLAYLSILCLAAVDPQTKQEITVRKMLNFNIILRREYMKRTVVPDAKILAVLPEYTLPYAIHMLAHDPDFASVQDSRGLQLIHQVNYSGVLPLYKTRQVLRKATEEELPRRILDQVDRVKMVHRHARHFRYNRPFGSLRLFGRCLSLLLDCLITKNDKSGLVFCKKLCENIKTTKDKQSPDSASSNAKLYAVCDVALNILSSKKVQNGITKLSTEPVLPTRLFTKPSSISQRSSLLSATLKALSIKERMQTKSSSMSTNVNPRSTVPDQMTIPVSGFTADGNSHFAVLVSPSYSGPAVSRIRSSTKLDKQINSLTYVLESGQKYDSDQMNNAAVGSKKLHKTGSQITYPVDQYDAGSKDAASLTSENLGRTMSPITHALDFDDEQNLCPMTSPSLGSETLQKGFSGRTYTIDSDHENDPSPVTSPILGSYNSDQAVSTTTAQDSEYEHRTSSVTSPILSSYTSRKAVSAMTPAQDSEDEDGPSIGASPILESDNLHTAVTPKIHALDSDDEDSPSPMTSPILRSDNLHMAVSAIVPAPDSDDEDNPSPMTSPILRSDNLHTAVTPITDATDSEDSPTPVISPSHRSSGIVHSTAISVAASVEERDPTIGSNEQEHQDISMESSPLELQHLQQNPSPTTTPTPGPDSLPRQTTPATTSVPQLCQTVTGSSSLESNVCGKDGIVSRSKSTALSKSTELHGRVSESLNTLSFQAQTCSAEQDMVSGFDCINKTAFSQFKASVAEYCKLDLQQISTAVENENQLISEEFLFSIEENTLPEECIFPYKSSPLPETCAEYLRDMKTEELLPLSETCTVARGNQNIRAANNNKLSKKSHVKASRKAVTVKNKSRLKPHNVTQKLHGDSGDSRIFQSLQERVPNERPLTFIKDSIADEGKDIEIKPVSHAVYEPSVGTSIPLNVTRATTGSEIIKSLATTPTVSDKTAHTGKSNAAESIAGKHQDQVMDLKSTHMSHSSPSSQLCSISELKNTSAASELTASTLQIKPLLFDKTDQPLEPLDNFETQESLPLSQTGDALASEAIQQSPPTEYYAMNSEGGRMVSVSKSLSGRNVRGIDIRIKEHSSEINDTAVTASSKCSGAVNDSSSKCSGAVNDSSSKCSAAITDLTSKSSDAVNDLTLSKASAALNVLKKSDVVTNKNSKLLAQTKLPAGERTSYSQHTLPVTGLSSNTNEMSPCNETFKEAAKETQSDKVLSIFDDGNPLQESPGPLKLLSSLKTCDQYIGDKELDELFPCSEKFTFHKTAEDNAREDKGKPIQEDNAREDKRKPIQEDNARTTKTTRAARTKSKIKSQLSTYNQAKATQNFDEHNRLNASASQAHQECTPKGREFTFSADSLQVVSCVRNTEDLPNLCNIRKPSVAAATLKSDAITTSNKAGSQTLKFPATTPIVPDDSVEIEDHIQVEVIPENQKKPIESVMSKHISPVLGDGLLAQGSKMSKNTNVSLDMRAGIYPQKTENLSFLAVNNAIHSSESTDHLSPLKVLENLPSTKRDSRSVAASISRFSLSVVEHCRQGSNAAIQNGPTVAFNVECSDIFSEKQGSAIKDRGTSKSTASLKASSCSNVLCPTSVSVLSVQQLTNNKVASSECTLPLLCASGKLSLASPLDIAFGEAITEPGEMLSRIGDCDMTKELVGDKLILPPEKCDQLLGNTELYQLFPIPEGCTMSKENITEGSKRNLMPENIPRTATDGTASARKSRLKSKRHAPPLSSADMVENDTQSASTTQGHLKLVQNEELACMKYVQHIANPVKKKESVPNVLHYSTSLDHAEPVVTKTVKDPDNTRSNEESWTSRSLMTEPFLSSNSVDEQRCMRHELIDGSEQQPLVSLSDNAQGSRSSRSKGCRTSNRGALDKINLPSSFQTVHSIMILDADQKVQAKSSQSNNYPKCHEPEDPLGFANADELESCSQLSSKHICSKSKSNVSNQKASKPQQELAIEPEIGNQPDESAAVIDARRVACCIKKSGLEQSDSDLSHSDRCKPRISVSKTSLTLGSFNSSGNQKDTHAFPSVADTDSIQYGKDSSKSQSHCKKSMKQNTQEKSSTSKSTSQQSGDSQRKRSEATKCLEITSEQREIKPMSELKTYFQTQSENFKLMEEGKQKSDELRNTGSVQLSNELTSSSNKCSTPLTDMKLSSHQQALHWESIQK